MSAKSTTGARRGRKSVAAPTNENTPRTITTNGRRADPDALARKAYRLKEAADVLGLSRWSLARAIDAGEIGTVRFGSTRLIPVTEVDRVLTVRLERREATK